MTPTPNNPPEMMAFPETSNGCRGELTRIPNLLNVAILALSVVMDAVEILNKPLNVMLFAEMVVATKLLAVMDPLNIDVWRTTN